jgi:ferredoxin-nitrite reductase
VSAGEFTEEQKHYLEGLGRGFAAARAGSAPAQATGPEKIHFAAQDRIVAAGGKLCREEEAKRAKHPFDMWEEIAANAKKGQFPKGTDAFLYKYHGLFHVAPTQDSFMLRLRIPNGIVDSRKMRAVAAIADELGGGYAHVTTRANLQVREIGPRNPRKVLERLADAGLTSRGAGADNIRNITGNPTAGIDPSELYDTRPLGLELYHAILNQRELFGLPRKFNIAFDGGGRVAVLEDTNDIGFTAVAVPEGNTVPAGIYVRLALGGITGHGTFAADTGIILRPEECVPVAAAVVRAFIEHGDRTDRKKARMKYVIDRLGLDAYMAEVEKHLGGKLARLPIEACRPRPPRLKDGHIGVHAQKQPGLSYIGVTAPAGRLSSRQMRDVADIANRFGSGTVRLTVWQNLLVSDVPEACIEDAKRVIEAAGLAWSPTNIRGSVVACTGNAGCKFAASDTKAHALAVTRHLDGRVSLDQPINIHLTGCPHSCAQHFVADLGLLGAKVGENAIEGYHISIGGSAGDRQELARELYRDVPAAAAPAVLERVLATYLERRRPGETFQSFATRHSVDELKQLVGAFPRGASE